MYSLYAVNRGLLRSQCPARVARATFLATRALSSELPSSSDGASSNFRTLHELQRNACIEHSENDLFGTFSATTGQFEYMTYNDYAGKVERARSVLSKAGVGQFDKVAIISNNRWEWAVVAAATYSLNATFIPMYQAQLPRDWTYIINDSGTSVVFCATEEVHDTVQREVLPSTPSVQATICFDAPEGPDFSFATAMKAAGAGTTSVVAPSQDDLANLIYTSGTTGNPKGVELTHFNATSNIKAAMSMTEDENELMGPGDCTLALLPWAHIYAQTAEVWFGMQRGIKLGICRGPTFLLEDLQLVKPSVMFAVPALYKQVHAGVSNVIETESGLKSTLLKSAVDLGRKNAEAKAGERSALGPIDRLKYTLLDRMVLSKIRARFGGNMRWGGAAGAGTPPEVLKFMEAIGIPVMEGYGLTETSPIVTLNTPSKRKIGSVGPPIPGCSVYIVDENGDVLPPGTEGEICVVGHNIMKGYYNNPEATEEVISVAPDGKSRMFHTGDLGQLDSEGFLKITGRLKEQYKLENGKYVVPNLVENEISLSRFVGQVLLHGANMPYNIALIVPAWDAIREELDLGDDIGEEECAKDDRVLKLVEAELAQSLYKVKKYEHPKKWAFVPPFTVENHMLTPKLSMKRHNIVKAHDSVIAKLYGLNSDSDEDEQVA